jgi:hypothetical protein
MLLPIHYNARDVGGWALIKNQLAQLYAEWRIPLADFLAYLLPHFFRRIYHAIGNKPSVRYIQYITFQIFASIFVFEKKQQNFLQNYKIFCKIAKKFANIQKRKFSFQS